MVDLFSTALTGWREFMMRCNVKGRKRNESRCLLDTELHTQMKDERHGDSPKKKLNHNLYKEKNIAGR